MIDNEVYDRLGETWWDEGNVLNMLHGSCTPGRMAYFRRVLREQIAGELKGLRALDIGCGCGFLAEEFAKLGFEVTGVDPSATAVEAARRHAAASGLTIDYRIGSGEDLPVASEDFDVVYCCDVLEHVSDLPKVIAETSRALRPKAVYLFDTVNRTFLSQLLAIKVMQTWRWTRLASTPLHVWEMFIRPEELDTLLRTNQLRLGEIVGLAPRENPAALLWNFTRARRGKISYGELSRRIDFGEVRNTSVSYMGFARKA